MGFGGVTVTLLGAGAVTQKVKLLLVRPACHIRALIPVLAAPLPVQLPVDTPWKTVQESPGAWTPATYVGETNAACRLLILLRPRVSHRSYLGNKTTR